MENVSMTNRKTLNDVIYNDDLAARIFDNLSIQEVRQLAGVNKLWRLRTNDALANRQFDLNLNLIKKLRASNRSPLEYIKKNHKYLTDLKLSTSDDSADKIPNDFYDNLIISDLRARRLIISGSGQWSTCKCPTGQSKCGELCDPVKPSEMTNLEYIHIKSPFKIGSCTLLDLVSRSPRLKTLIFCGLILISKHSDEFSYKFFHCDLEKVYWPNPTKKQRPALKMLVKRNENIETLHVPFHELRDLLSSESVPNLKYLSLVMREDWISWNAVPQVKSYSKVVPYLTLAKKLVGLEVITEAYLHELAELDPDLREKFDDNYLEYKVQFWKQVSELPDLKYLCIRGKWDTETICQELAKNSMQVEYLRLFICPRKGHLLTMSEGVKALAKLAKLKYVQLESDGRFDKVDKKTIQAFKDIVDKIWNINLNCVYADEIDQLYSYLLRRGRQLGNKYKLLMTLRHKNPKYSLFFHQSRLDKIKPGQSLGHCIIVPAELMIGNRVKQNSCHYWGLEICSNIMDKQRFTQAQETFNLFNELFGPTQRISSIT